MWSIPAWGLAVTLWPVTHLPQFIGDVMDGGTVIYSPLQEGWPSSRTGGALAWQLRAGAG